MESLRAGARPRRRPSGLHAAVRPRAVRRAGRAGADVELWTSRFDYGAGRRARRLPRRRGASTAGPPGAPGSRARRAARLAQHVPDLLRYRRAAAAADVVHFQWLPVQALDWALLPPRRPRLITAHDVLPREARPGPARRPARALRAHGRGDRPLRARRGAAARRGRRGPGEGPRDPARRVPPARRGWSPRRSRRSSARAADAARSPLLRPDAALQGHRRAARRLGARRAAAGRGAVDRRQAAHGRRGAARARAAGRALGHALRRPTPSSRRCSAPPTSPCSPTARSTSRACSTPRWRSARRCCSARSAASPRSPRRGAAELVAAGRRRRAGAARSARCSRDPARRGRAAPTAARAGRRARRPLRLGRDRPRRRSRSTRARGRARRSRPATMPRRARRVLDPRRPARLGAGRLRRCSWPRCAALRGERPRTGLGPERPAAGLADRRRPPRGGGDRGQGPQRARARLAARAARGDRRGRRRRRAGATHGRARPRAGADQVLELPARRQGRAPRTPAVARAARRRCSRSPTPTRAGSPARCAALAAAFEDPEVAYACGQVALRQRGRRRTRRASTGATSCGCARTSPRSRSVTAGNGAIYAVRRDAYVEGDPRVSHDLALPFRLVKGGLRAVYVARGARDRADGARRSRASGRASGG